jgi:hypothetical protein
MSPVDGWISKLAPHHHEQKQLELSSARSIAKDWRLGWYVAPFRDLWTIGKMNVTGPLRRYTIVRDDGSPLHFPSVEDALEFYRRELGVFGVAMFQS